jgi:hypothetical protein
MQGYPFEELTLTDYPLLAVLITDTASPRIHIPVYYIHDKNQPFCRNSLCLCHRQQQEIRRLLHLIVDGIMTLREAADFIEVRREGEG